MKQYWSMTEGVFNCLIDTERTVAFAKAIQNVVKQGDVVVDLGTGSGILAMIAAKAGARKVYAVERDENNIRTLESTFISNNLAEVIEVIHGDATETSLPEDIDLIIAEMIATALIEELQIPAMNNALSYAKRSTKVLLETYTTFADLVFHNSKYHGFQFNIFRYEYPDDTTLASEVYSEKILITHADFTRPIDDTTVDKEVEVDIQKPGIINAIRLSGLTTFCDGSTLQESSAYSYPLLLPIRPTDVTPGEKYKIRLRYEMASSLNSLEYLVTKL